MKIEKKILSFFLKSSKVKPLLTQDDRSTEVHLVECLAFDKEKTGSNPTVDIRDFPTFLKSGPGAC